VTVNGTGVATIATATMSFESHAHDYRDVDGGDDAECTDYQSHAIDPDAPGYAASGSVSVNGSPVYLHRDFVTIDPGSDGFVDIDTTGGNSSVSNTTH
jgi:hypothetical protein